MNLKEEFNQKFISRLADEFFFAYPKFNKNEFVAYLGLLDWKNMELKQRMRAITLTINDFLKVPYSAQLKILMLVAPKFSGIQGFIFSDFVQVFGLENYLASINALEFFTQYSTSEFAIRPFIEKYPTETLNQLVIWTKSENHHIRRLSSEGSRPKLPWAPPLREFIKNPNPVLPLLENLKNDESLYVRKSVANHLNDISKNHPELVLTICNRWYGISHHTNWIVKHALRTLLKKGDKQALSIFGTANADNILVEKLVLSKNKLKIGEEITFSFELKNSNANDKNLRLEYLIHFVKLNRTTSSKIFKINESVLGANSQKQLVRKHKFADLSTRKHYPGKHTLSLIVNGDVMKTIDFELM